MNNPGLEVRPAGLKGRGLFTRHPLSAGSRVLVLEGQLLPTEAVVGDLLALQVGPDMWLCSDGTMMDDFANHSCDPNTGFLNGDPVLYALRDIEAGEEICWDYSTSIAEAGWSLNCRCGTELCRGVVRPWGEISERERDRLRGQALSYLRGW